MGHIFISYSHKDTKYAHGLADHLKNMGFDTWIDERLDYGSQWPHEIQKQLDSCDAFLLIMTSRSFASDWVQSELQRAKRKLKPIFPLLLEGDEPWLSVESTQYYDVRGEIFPDARFYSAIKRVVSTSQGDEIIDRLPRVDSKKDSTTPRPKMKTELLAAVIGGIATVIAACATMVGPLMSLVNQESSLTEPPVSGVVSQVTEPQPEATATAFVPSPITTATIPPTLTIVPPTATLPPTLTPIPSNTPIPPIPQEERTDNTIVEGDLFSCPMGYAIGGVRADRKQLLCRRVMRVGEEYFVETRADVDPITARQEMHACPWGMYLRGINLQQNLLLCSYDSRRGTPNEWQGEQANTIDIPGSAGFDMHICPEPAGSITYLTGIRADQNRFLCATHNL
jgi:hypothetical protein